MGKWLGRADVTVEGEKVGIAAVEETSSGGQIVHIDGEQVGVEALAETGFQIGEVPPPEVIEEV